MRSERRANGDEYMHEANVQRSTRTVVRRMRGIWGLSITDRERMGGICGNCFDDLFDSKAHVAEIVSHASCEDIPPTIWEENKFSTEKYAFCRQPRNKRRNHRRTYEGESDTFQEALIGRFIANLNSGTIPSACLTPGTMLLKKEGKLEDLNTSCPIAILLHLHKLFTRDSESNVRNYGSEQRASKF